MTTSDGKTEMHQKPIVRPSRRQWATVIVWLALSHCAQAQALYRPEPAEVKSRVATVLRFYQLADKATPQEMDQLAELEAKIETPEVAMRDRLQAYLELYRLLYRLNGVASRQRR